ncbi:hypothetical protein HNR39_003685 [Glaciimonas immobilis]|uniref:Uncharacterized protein n=1 Tax=Glaciimonas immobilis TaxID=728004 RepID=A0A840RTG2_9BURK|nr:hypothetical protein [Glaciimonas immobilis]
MKKIELIRKLSELDRRGVYVMARRDIEKLFPEEGEKAMEKSLQRRVADGLLQRGQRAIPTHPQPAKIAGSPNRSPRHQGLRRKAHREAWVLSHC